ncbi:hypothetical protein K450DRAFT_301105 [Umbelopsis ramanniana AG]|uniref:PH domain-containing protein n=1 Tax=Umbelopsis ramanniana AG TaxID=1314678 RepID=A0AAD5E8U5_UMBRA|nr:uncharacterized protein K450DRAFT_301105 [Umbelopsis ramanniana AG]KAI8578465.1 hypothetical protein K450DRAFT_301105 [Umbelopsis ramanniana AG]
MHGLYILQLAKMFEISKKKTAEDGRKSSHELSAANQVTNIQTLKEWWSTVKSSINIPKKIMPSGPGVKKIKTQSTSGQQRTVLKPILKKKMATFPPNFDIPSVSDLYYASQLSMPKLETIPWHHPYAAPMGYYSMDNFHMKDPMYHTPTASPNVPQRKSSLAWNEEVQVVPALSGTKYNRKPHADATYMNLTPNIKSAIRDELNYYKMNEMEVHELSMSHTVFH